jgi:hypothetical protein
MIRRINNSYHSFWMAYHRAVVKSWKGQLKFIFERLDLSHIDNQAFFDKWTKKIQEQDMRYLGHVMLRSRESRAIDPYAVRTEQNDTSVDNATVTTSDNGPVEPSDLDEAARAIGLPAVCKRLGTDPLTRCVSISRHAGDCKTWQVTDNLAQRYLGDIEPGPGEDADEYHARMRRATNAFNQKFPGWCLLDCNGQLSGKKVKQTS